MKELKIDEPAKQPDKIICYLCDNEINEKQLPEAVPLEKGLVHRGCIRS